MDDIPISDDLAANARREFAEFYRLASPKDALLLDRLILAHAASAETAGLPLKAMVPSIRKQVTQLSQNMEHECTRLLETLRACPTYQQVADSERQAIERVFSSVKANGRQA